MDSNPQKRSFHKQVKQVIPNEANDKKLIYSQLHVMQSFYQGYHQIIENAIKGKGKDQMRSVIQGDCPQSTMKNQMNYTGAFYRKRSNKSSILELLQSRISPQNDRSSVKYQRPIQNAQSQPRETSPYIPMISAQTQIKSEQIINRKSQSNIPSSLKSKTAYSFFPQGSPQVTKNLQITCSNKIQLEKHQNLFADQRGSQQAIPSKFDPYRKQFKQKPSGSNQPYLVFSDSSNNADILNQRVQNVLTSESEMFKVTKTNFLKTASVTNQNYGLPNITVNRSRTPKEDADKRKHRNDIIYSSTGTIKFPDQQKNQNAMQNNSQLIQSIRLSPNNHVISQQQFLKLQQYNYQHLLTQSQLNNSGNQSSYSVLQKKRVQIGGYSAQGIRSNIGNKTAKQNFKSCLANSSLLCHENGVIIEQASEDKELATQLGKLAKPKELSYQNTGIKLGQGKYGPIELIIYRKELYALKKIPKSTIDRAKRIEHVKNEKKICHLVKEIVKKEGQDFFVSLEETFTDFDSINFIFEYLPGQDLYWVTQNEMSKNKVMQKLNGPQDWVKFYAAEVLIALELLHKNSIIYRDLKPENVMIDWEGHVKLIDFGFAKRLNPSNKFRTFTNCGTLGYTAPEVLMNISQGYSFQADIWTYGIFICELIQSGLPFEKQDDQMTIEEQIIKCDIKIPRDADQNTRDLLSQIFVLEPNLRISIQEIKSHKFFQDIRWKEVEKRQQREVPYLPNPHKFRHLLDDNTQYETTCNSTALSKNSSPIKKNVLGDFTLYKVNKEFENF